MWRARLDKFELRFIIVMICSLFSRVQSPFDIVSVSCFPLHSLCVLPRHASLICSSKRYTTVYCNAAETAAPHFTSWYFLYCEASYLTCLTHATQYKVMYTTSFNTMSLSYTTVLCTADHGELFDSDTMAKLVSWRGLQTTWGKTPPGWRGVEIKSVSSIVLWSGGACLNLCGEL